MAHTAVLHSLDADDVEVMVERLSGLGGVADETEAIDRIAALERLKSAASAAQARITATLHEGRVAKETASGVPAARARRWAHGTSGWPARWWTSCPAHWRT